MMKEGRGRGKEGRDVEVYTSGRGDTSTATMQNDQYCLGVHWHGHIHKSYQALHQPRISAAGHKG